MATSVLARPYVTLEAFYRTHDLPDQVELADGVVIVSPSGSSGHGWVSRALFLALHDHVAARRLGEVYHDGFGYELPIAARPDTLRVPDVSFVRDGRVPRLSRRRAFALAPDLAVEVRSPHERKGELRAKLVDHLEAGTPLVWVADPKRSTVEVFTPDGGADRGRQLAPGDVLDGGTILPGFTLPVGELFPDMDDE